MKGNRLAFGEIVVLLSTTKRFSTGGGLKDLMAHERLTIGFNHRGGGWWPPDSEVRDCFNTSGPSDTHVGLGRLSDQPR